MKQLISLLILLVTFQCAAQEKGVYRHSCSPPEPNPKTLKDSVPSVGLPVLKIDPRIIIAGFRDETLEIKSFHRFKINGSRIITTYGLNTDNPTIYGHYKVENDTLILECKKSIQHFNKLAPKRRVKTKLDTVYRFQMKEEGKLMTSEYCFWYLLMEVEVQ